MLERIRRALAGPSTAATGVLRTGSHGLDAFDASTPHRFRTWLENSVDRERVSELSSRRLLGKAAVSILDEDDGRVRIEFVSEPGHRRPTILGSLDAVHQAGVSMQGFEALDLVTDVDEDELRRTVDGYHNERQGERGFRRRLEALAGPQLIEWALAGWARSAGPDGKEFLAFEWGAAAGYAAFNTPGGETVLLNHALAVAHGNVGGQFITGARDRVRLCVRTGLPYAVPESALLTLLRRRGLAGGAGVELAGDLPSPWSDAVVQALCAIARRPGTNALYALIALRRAPASSSVRSAVEAALEAVDPDVQSVALETLATLIGTEARPVWEAFLESRSANRRMTAETVIGEHGDAQDVPRAAVYLAKLIRSRPATEMSPPRASSFIELLVRHREVPEALAALQDVTARWARLAPELRAWIEAKHGWLVPADAGRSSGGVAAATADESDALELESPLEWPMPTIDRNGRNVRLEFWEMDHDVRDRFQDLLESESQITVVDGDREWLTLIVDADRPEQLLAQLWARAHEASA